MDKVKIHEDICKKLNNTYKAKNSDYGESFSKVRQEYPNAILIRLMDKLERLKQLYRGGERKVADESIEDTLIDLANYAILELVEREAEIRGDTRDFYMEAMEGWREERCKNQYQ